MRCVDRGDAPCDGDGRPLSFRPYQTAATHLKERLGRYCSFCERKVPTGLAVEHRLPRSAAPELECAWGNFLLACFNCNSVKGRQLVEHAAVLWPDLDNTLAAFAYHPSGRISVSEQLAPAVQARSRRLLNLVGLDRGPGETPSDHRWFDRLEVWGLALQSALDYQAQPAPRIAQRIVETAVSVGGFSIWMTTFAGWPDMQAMFSAAFPGTVARPDWPVASAS